MATTDLTILLKLKDEASGPLKGIQQQSSKFGDTL